MTIAGELRALADRVPAEGPAAVIVARERAVRTAEVVSAALGKDPTLAERQQRWIDLLGEVMRRLAGLGRQVLVAAESERLAAAGASTAYLGRVNSKATGELEAFASAAWPDWDSPARVRELSALRMPDPYELAEIADRLRREIAPALDLAHPDPGAVRLSDLADQIDNEVMPLTVVSPSARPRSCW